jgi:hypothetical protein
MLTVTDRRITVDTRTLTAVLDDGLITSLVRKSDGRELLRSKVDAAPALQLIYGKDEVVPLGGALDSNVRCLRLNDHHAEVRIGSWHGDGVIAVREDAASGDLVIEPSGYASRPGLRACRWTIAGIDAELELVAPFWQGVRLPLEDSLIRHTHWEWPLQWEAGLAILQGKDGGLWVHCRDTQYRYKNLKVGTPDDARRIGLDTENYGPLEERLAAGGLAWRINVYSGDWQVPAGLYRQWLSRAYQMEGRDHPEWVRDLRLAVSWCPTDLAVLDALAAHVDPKCVLLHVPNWRTDGYDENYPTFQASAAGRAFVGKARSMGYRVMPHFNAIDMDPTNPAYPYVRDFEYRNAITKRVHGWSWIDGAARGVPESNAARMRHRSEKVMVKVHPGLSMWRSILAENVQAAVQALSLDTVFLDVTHNAWNLANCLVENMTCVEGMKRLIAQVAGIEGVRVVGGEGRHEVVMSEEALAQVHLFQSSGHANVPGLERTGRCAVSEFLFGNWCRSFGYSWLSGDSPESQLRMQLHMDLGAIPTLTIQSAKEIEQPNDGVQQVLEAASV